MIAVFRALVIFLALSVASGSHSQQSTGTPLSAEDTKGSEVADPEKTQPAQHQQDAIPKAAIEHSPDQAQDNKTGSGNGRNGRNGKNPAHINAPKPEEVTAEYTIYLVFATIALVGATIVLAVATVGLYRETKNLAMQAKEASNDTKALIDLAKNSAEAAEKSANAAILGILSQKASVVYKNYQCGAAIKSKIANVYYEQAMIVSIDWVNVGPTVANDVVFSIDHRLLARNQHKTEFYSEIPDGITGFSLGTGVSGRTSFVIISHEDALKLARKELMLYVSSMARFKTVQEPDKYETNKFTAQIEVVRVRPLNEGGFNYDTVLHAAIDIKKLS